MNIAFDWVTGLVFAGVGIAIFTIIGLAISGITDLGYDDYLKGGAKLIAAVLLFVVMVAFFAGTEVS